MAYAGYQGAQSVGNYLSGASNAGSAASKVATAGTGVKMTPAKMKKLLKERVESYNLMTVKRSRGRPSKSY
jgi:hypothetical protein